MSRRFLTFTTACLLLAATVPFQALPAAAETAQQAALTEAAAVEKARALLNLSKQAYEFEAAELHSYSNFSGLPERSYWELEFLHLGKWVSVSIDANTGKLNYFYNQLDEPTGTDTFISPSEAREIAIAFLQKTAPEEFRQTVAVQEDFAWGYEYDFRFARVVNGIPVLHQELFVAVGWDGSISMYTMDWETGLKFQAADRIIPEEQARQTMADNIQMQLEYMTRYEGSPELMYRPYFTKGFAVDAASGAMFDEPIYFLRPDELPTTETLVKNGPKAPPTLAKELTRSEARQVAESLGLLPEDAVYQESMHQEYEDGEWFLEYESPGDLETETDNITYVFRLNAATGELVEFYGYLANIDLDEEYTEEEEGTGQLSSDQLLEIATAKAKTLFPHRTGALALQTHLVPDSDAFLFYRLVNGLPTEDYLELSLHPETGNVLNVTSNFSDAVAFPEPTVEVSAQEAKDIFTALPIELYYGFEENEEGLLNPVPALRYRFEQMLPNHVLIDAQTGDLTGLTSKNGAFLPDDIYGHWAEEALTRFAEADLLYTDMMNANPDQPITRSYLIELMIGHLKRTAPTDQTVFYKDVTEDHPSFYAVNAAAHLGWIAKDTHFRPDDLITREEMAILMAKAAGLDPKPYQKDALPYADAKNISWWSYGAVALNFKQGFMQGSDDNKFYPQGSLTVAEAVSMLYKYQH